MCKSRCVLRCTPTTGNPTSFMFSNISCVDLLKFPHWASTKFLLGTEYEDCKVCRAAAKGPFSFPGKGRREGLSAHYVNEKSFRRKNKISRLGTPKGFQSFARANDTVAKTPAHDVCRAHFERVSALLIPL